MDDSIIDLTPYQSATHTIAVVGGAPLDYGPMAFPIGRGQWFVQDSDGTLRVVLPPSG